MAIIKEKKQQPSKCECVKKPGPDQMLLRGCEAVWQPWKNNKVPQKMDRRVDI